MSGKKKRKREGEAVDKEAPEEPTLAEENPLADKTRECEELFAKLQRTTADYLNYQKRMDRRLEEGRQFAIRELVLDLLPVMDNFERALGAAEVEPDVEAFLEGVRLVHDQLLAALAKHGVEPIEAGAAPGATATKFDPERHEAVAHLPSDEHPEGHVTDVVQTGYRLHGRTLRPSRVAVSSGKGTEPPEEQSDDRPRRSGDREDTDTADK
ncbi:MAG TPA: nucleotide exchange factor GrpE [Phycisphaerae bacterium]|nr:nucleotide exchange factor GrpE [Phycisphaerae bacterium]HUS46070.1 nucleotide exchange factor GrpE [Phycisphaerae bacterium]